MASFLDKIRGNPLVKLSLRQLREEELKLGNQLGRLRNEIDQIDRKKKQNFQDGIGSDLFKKRMLAQEIQALDTEAKLTLRSFSTLQQQSKFVRNFLIVKKYEKQFKDKGMWKRLTEIPPAQLEKFLIRVDLDGKEFNEIVERLNGPFETEAEEGMREVDADERKILDMWSQVETGGLDREKAEETLSVEQRLAEEEHK